MKRTIKFRGKVDDEWEYATADTFIKWKQFWAGVDMRTAGEWIGRKDKNGVEIYEGDIVNYLDNTSQGLILKTVTIEDIRHLPDFTCSKWEEVIGNIYDNPELLRREGTQE